METLDELSRASRATASRWAARHGRIPQRADRVRRGALPAAQAAVAAGISWWLAHLLLGTPHPVFAPIVATVALGVTTGTRGRAAVETVFGVAFGVGVADVVNYLAGGGGPVAVTLVIFFAFVAGLVVGKSSTFIGQIAVTALIVTATFTNAPANPLLPARLAQALIGGATALLFSQVLFPVDVIERTRRTTRELLAAIAATLEAAAHDPGATPACLGELAGAAHRLEETLDMARSASRLSRRRGDLAALAAFADAERRLAAVASAAAAVGRIAERDPAAVASLEPEAEAAAHLARLIRSGGAGGTAEAPVVELVGEESLSTAAARKALAIAADELAAVGRSLTPAHVSPRGRPDSSSSEVSFVRDLFKGGNAFIARLALVAGIGGFLFGYDTGVIGGALLFVKKDLHAGSFGQEAIVGSILLGAMFGAIISGFLADAISRKWTKVISGSIYVVGALASAVSMTTWELVGARFVLGLSVGTASFVGPLYISELAPKRLRGGLVSFNQLMITSGIASAYLVNYLLKGATWNWRWMLGLGAVPGLALAIGMFFVPHSPRWLVEEGDRAAADEVLMRARDEDEEQVDEELDRIEEVAREEASIGELFGPRMRKMLLVGLGLAIFQQIVGINTVIYYAPTILSFAGAGSGGALAETLVIGVTNVVFTLIAILLLDKLGRRVFLLAGTAGVIASLATLGVFFASSTLKRDAGWLALVALVVYIASFAVGLGPVFWLMISEIYPLKLRGPAMSVATVANWGANFLVSFTFLTLTTSITKQGTFWLYGLIGIGAFVFFAALVPETKGRSLEEIESDLTGSGDQGTREHARA